MAKCTKCGAEMPEMSAGLKAWYAKPENAHLKPKTWCPDCCKGAKAKPKSTAQAQTQTSKPVANGSREVQLLLEIHRELVEVFSEAELKKCHELYGDIGWVTTIYLDRKRGSR